MYNILRIMFEGCRSIDSRDVVAKLESIFQIKLETDFTRKLRKIVCFIQHVEYWLLLAYFASYNNNIVITDSCHTDFYCLVSIYNHFKIK